MSKIKSSLRRHWVASLACAICVASIALPARAEEKISPEARAYFKNGVELLKGEAPNYQDAYYQFKLAYEKSKSWKVLGNYGLCALKLERDEEAIAFYDEYLKGGGKRIDKDEREAIERDLLLVKGNDATLDVSASASEFTLLDARARSSLGAQSYAITDGKRSLTLRAGEHHAVATAPDGRTLTWDFLLEPGQRASHHFDFDAPPPSAAKEVLPPPAPQAGLAASPPSPSEAGSGLRTAGFITAGIGVLALGSSVITGLMAKSQEHAATSQCNANRVCDPAAEGAFDKGTNLSHVTNYLLIGGGAATALGVGMIAIGWPRGTEHTNESASNVRIEPLLAPGTGGLLATGRF
ncbi:MAG: hypothetical protein ABI548_21245 [Polyangiaceae bacterium]